MILYEILKSLNLDDESLLGQFVSRSTMRYPIFVHFDERKNELYLWTDYRNETWIARSPWSKRWNSKNLKTQPVNKVLIFKR